MALAHRQDEQVRGAVHAAGQWAEEALKGEEARGRAATYLQECVDVVEEMSRDPNNQVARALLAGGMVKPLLLLHCRLTVLALKGEDLGTDQQMLYDATHLLQLVCMSDPNSSGVQMDWESLRSLFSAVRARPPALKELGPCAHPLGVAHALTPAAPPIHDLRRYWRRASTPTCGR